MSFVPKRKEAFVGSDVSRRTFVEFCGALLVSAPFGLSLTKNASAADVAKTLSHTRKPSVIWLHFQDCTGCSESLLRTTQPDVATLIFDLISLDYHETLMAASGYQAELALRDATVENAGKYVLVVEGSIPRGKEGEYLRVGGRLGTEILEEAAKDAAAIVAIGSCASFGGVPSAAPNPTGAASVDALVTGKPIVNLPGCPPNPYTFLATVLEYAAFGKVPALDAEKRPKFAYDHLIHDHCPRRGHFDKGEFAEGFGDDGHRKGWCLYKLGCKGPVTHAACSTRHFNEVPDAWPIGIGAPCIGCTERKTAFTVPQFDQVPIHQVVPAATYPPITAPKGKVDPVVVGLTAAAVGGVVGATYVASRRLPVVQTHHHEIKPPEAGK